MLLQVGKLNTAKSCLHFNKLADSDEAVLVGIIAEGVAYMRTRYTTHDH